METPEEEIPVGLRTLAAELDALAGSSNGPSVDGLPDSSGTDFRLLRPIGRGGMGEVYEATQLSLDRPVAVKLLPSECVSDDEASFRFRMESRMVARLHHPNIVQVLAAGEMNGRPYFAMELVKGQPAADRRFARLEDLARFGIRVADALAYAHACGVVHRDVKPSNVFVGEDGQVKLGDFGLACLATASARDRSGTHKYMSPEQAAGGPASAKSDQYSFGAMLLELSEPLQAVRRNADFAAILDKTTAEDPSRRYATMTEVAEDLACFLRREPVRARPAGALSHFGHITSCPVAAIGLVAAALGLVGFVVALLIGSVRTSRALAETERALRQVESEAGRAALSLATTLAPDDRPSGDYRAREIERAIASVTVLSERFPDNAEIKSALGRLRLAKEAHARFRERRGDGASGTSRRNPRGRRDANSP